MACETWREKLDAYLDGEMEGADASTLAEHLRGCASCGADALGRVQIKRAVATAGKRYEASAEFRQRILKNVAAKPRHEMGWLWKIAVPAFAVVIAAAAMVLYVGRENARRERVFSELADLHVAALASATPVDVVSTDRHTVKPWFQGRIPFTFNLPELQGSEFTLVGGRVTYLGQSPGAHLIYQLRKHEISVFIFQDRESRGMTTSAERALSFNTESWSQNGLRYFVVGDVSAEDIAALSKLLRNAA